MTQPTFPAVTQGEVECFKLATQVVELVQRSEVLRSDVIDLLAGLAVAVGEEIGLDAEAVAARLRIAALNAHRSAAALQARSAAGKVV